MVNTLGFEEGVLTLKRAGYDALDLSLFRMTRNDSPYVCDGWREYTEAQRRFADANGIVFNQATLRFLSNGTIPRCVRERLSRACSARSK